MHSFLWDAHVGLEIQKTVQEKRFLFTSEVMGDAESDRLAFLFGWCYGYDDPSDDKIIF